MRKDQWDEIFEALWGGVRRAGDGVATLNRKQRLELDNFARRVRDKDADEATRYEHNRYNPGDLDDGVARNFDAERYDKTVLEEDVVLFRAGDYSDPTDPDDTRWKGSYWSDSPPMSEIQTRIDFAVEAVWLDKAGRIEGRSPLTHGYAVLIPKGTTVYTGPVASRGRALLGGAGDQMYIPWNTPGLQQLARWQLS